MRCLFESINNGLLVSAIRNGTIPPLLVKYQLDEYLPHVRQIWFDGTPAYRDVILSHPSIYQDYTFIVTSVKNIKQLPDGVRHLRVGGMNEKMCILLAVLSKFRSLCSLELFDRYRGQAVLSLDHDRLPSNVPVLLNSPNMVNCERLSIDTGLFYLGDLCKELANSTVFKSLKGLLLRGSPGSLNLLADSSTLANCETLIIEYHTLDKICESIAGGSSLTTLQTLILAGGGVTDIGTQQLADSQFLTSLRSLAIYSDIGPNGLRAIATSTVLSNLEQLKLDSTMIGIRDVIISPTPPP